LIEPKEASRERASEWKGKVGGKGKERKGRKEKSKWPFEVELAKGELRRW